VKTRGEKVKEKEAREKTEEKENAREKESPSVPLTSDVKQRRIMID
jgi:hypothetical protein